jgi:hypothetical protein
MNNFYLYRFANKRLSVLIPWDQDNSFDSMSMPPSWNLANNVLTAKIWNEPKYRSMYLGKLLDIADSVSSGWLEQEAAREYEQIREAVYLDPTTPYSRDDFEQANAYVQQFARERPEIVRQLVRSLAPEVFNGRSRTLRLQGR